MNRTYFIGILLITASLFAGCTKENTEDCFSGLRLDFYFTHHTGNGNLFGEKVRRIHVYLFDTEGILQLHATDNGDKLEYSYLQNGQVQTVSKPNPWGKLSDEYMMKLDRFVSSRTEGVKGLNNQYQLRACYDRVAPFYKNEKQAAKYAKSGRAKNRTKTSTKKEYKK